MTRALVRLIKLRRALPGLAASNGTRFDRWHWRLLACLIVCCVGFSNPGMAKSGAANGQIKPDTKNEKELAKILTAPKIDSSQPMLLQADEMVYDNENNRVTARGNVEIYYGNYVLLADQVIYDRNNNTLAAKGNVSIKDPQGAVITADHMTLTDDFRDGFIDALKLVTKDDTRIAAETATREAGNVTVFQNGWFTPCKPCEDNPEAPPTWRIRASKIIHRKDEATITYRNAFFDFYGVPVIWVPYFQMADPTVKRKSGFLMPTYTNDSQLGNTVTVPYYFALSDNYDFTFAPTYTEKAGTLLQGQWRHQLANGAYNLNLMGVFNPQGDPATPAGEDFRGSLDSTGKFYLDPYYALGWNVQADTDDTFRRFYNIDNKFKTDRVSQVYLEGLQDRNYFSTRLYNTGGLEFYDTPVSEAWVLPVVDYDYIVNQPILGGELSFDSNLTSLTSHGAPDSTRLTSEVNWRRQMIDGMGQVYTPFAQLRGDVYDVNNFTDPSNNRPSNGATALGNAVAGIDYRYPFVTTTGSVTHVLEPIGQIIARPDSIGNQQAIPNEDANSLVFDDTLLFDIDKFSGYDRIETGTRANVGAQYTAQFYSGAYARAVFGESYQLAGQNEFALSAPGSGLATDRSDYVGGLYVQASDNLAFIGQTRFDQASWEIRRTDLGSTVQYGPAQLKMEYANVRDAPGLGQGDTQQEIFTNGSLALTDNWSLLGNIRFDLETSRRVQDGLGVRYQNDCFALGVTYLETNIKDLDIQPDKTFMVNFTLKDLGSYAFKTDAFGLASDVPNFGSPTGVSASGVPN
jgi:LPS-assembly protein